MARRLQAITFVTDQLSRFGIERSNRLVTRLVKETIDSIVRLGLTTYIAKAPLGSVRLESLAR